MEALHICRAFLLICVLYPIAVLLSGRTYPKQKSLTTFHRKAFYHLNLEAYAGLATPLLGTIASFTVLRIFDTTRYGSAFDAGRRSSR